MKKIPLPFVLQIPAVGSARQQKSSHDIYRRTEIGVEADRDVFQKLRHSFAACIHRFLENGNSELLLCLRLRQTDAERRDAHIHVQVSSLPFPPR